MSTKSAQTGDGPPKDSSKQEPPFIVAYFDPEIRAKDSSNRNLGDILKYSDNQISSKHDFIQYLFPLPEESMVNWRAPLITKAVYEAFRDREELRSELLQALQRMLSFYGFTLESTAADVKVVPAQNFKQQSKYSWRTAMDHNHLRLTRMVRCLRVLSCEQEAQALYRALLEHDGGVVRSSTKVFWARAAERPLWLPPDEPDDNAEGIRWLRDVCEAEREGNAEELQASQSEGELNDDKAGRSPNGTEEESELSKHQ